MTQSDRQSHRNSARRRQAALLPHLESLEGRIVLSSTSTAYLVASTPLVQDRLTTDNDISLMRATVRERLADLKSVATQVKDAIALGIEELSHQLTADKATHDTADATEDKTLIGVDKYEYEQISRMENKQLSVGDQVLKALGKDSFQEDKDISRDLNALKKDPGNADAIDAVGAAQSAGIEAKATGVYNDELSNLTTVEGVLELIPPRTGSGTVTPYVPPPSTGPGGTVTAGGFTYGDGSFQEPTSVGTFSTNIKFNRLSITPTQLNAVLRLDNTPDRDGNANDPARPQVLQITDATGSNGIYKGTAQDITNNGKGGTLIPVTIAVSSDGQINILFNNTTNVKAQFSPLKK